MRTVTGPGASFRGGHSRLWHGLWAAMLALLSTAAAPSYADEPTMSRAVARGQGLLWRIEGRGDAPSFVFGTMHVGDPRVTALAPPVRTAFDDARSFTLETEMGYTAYAGVVEAMFYDDGRSLRDVLDQKLFQKVVDIMAQRGFSERYVANLKPWAVMASMGSPLASGGVALDFQLYTDAMRQEKPVYGLETLEEQLGVFDAMPRQAQIEMVQFAVDNHAVRTRRFSALLEAYLARDLNRLAKLARGFTASAYPVFNRHFEERVIDHRNRRMVERMQTRLQEGGAFIAVGALHLPGEAGILHLLEKRGYTVTPVY